MPSAISSVRRAGPGVRRRLCKSGRGGGLRRRVRSHRRSAGAVRARAPPRQGAGLAKALELDPENGDAHLQRAYLAAFDDLTAAEADYRRGLELSPNSASGYAGLAVVLYESPARRDEALELLDRARRD